MRWLTAALLTCVLLAPMSAQALPKSTDDMIKHLEVLGYTCKKDASDEDGFVMVNHETYFNFGFYGGGQGISFVTNFDIKPEFKDNPVPVLKKLNEVMEKTVWMPQLYMYMSKNNTPVLRMQAWLPDSYERKSFADFMARWQQDTNDAFKAMKEYLL
ncbi:MAG: YbjN domain-containing protein [Candidatus Sericytochromatia bacterium]